MANNPFIFLAMAWAVRGALGQYPKTSSWRETDIQAAKLERMLSTLANKYTIAQLQPAPSELKVLRRKLGPEIHKLDQQSKKMMKLFEKVVEESFFSVPRKETRKQFRKDMMSMNKVLEQKLYEGVQQFQKDITKRKRLSD